MKALVLGLLFLFSLSAYAAEECKPLKAIEGEYVLKSISPALQVDEGSIGFAVDGCLLKTSDGLSITLDGVSRPVKNYIIKAEMLPLDTGWSRESFLNMIRGITLKFKISLESVGDSYSYDENGEAVKTSKMIFTYSLDNDGNLEGLIEVYDDKGHLFTEAKAKYEKLEP